MYHGYKDYTLPLSCSYKIGDEAEELQYNLRGMKESTMLFARMRLEESLKELDTTYNTYKKLMERLK